MWRSEQRDCKRQCYDKDENRRYSSMGTAKDALDAKASTCDYGYYEDPFLSYLRSSSQQQQEEGRSVQPLIRKGTYARVSCMDRVLSSFLSSFPAKKEKQIVILGSGMDTLYWRAKAGLLPVSNVTTARWYEVDFAPMIESKCQKLSTCPLMDIHVQPSKHKLNSQSSSSSSTTILSSSYSIAFQKFTEKANFFQHAHVPADNDDDHDHDDHVPPTNSPDYHLVSYDLQQDCTVLFSELYQHFDFQYNVPTLFVMECVQMYLSEPSSRQLLQTISQLCVEPILAIYDPILQNDAFGIVMKQNLLQRFSQNPNMSVFQTKTLQQQLQKLKDSGYSTAIACHMMNAYESIVTPQQRNIANQCEMLDEMEEFILLMHHYCFLLAGKQQQQQPTSSNTPSITETLCSTQPNNPIGFQRQKCFTIP